MIYSSIVIMNLNQETEHQAGPSFRACSSKKVVKWLMDEGDRAARNEYDNILHILGAVTEGNEYLKTRCFSPCSAGDSKKLLCLDDREFINTLNKNQKKLEDVLNCIERLKQREIEDQVLQRDEIKKEEDKWKRRMRKAEAEIVALRRDVNKYESWYIEQKKLLDGKSHELAKQRTDFEFFQNSMTGRLERRDCELGETGNELDVTKKRYEGVCSRLQTLESQLNIIAEARKTDLDNMMLLEGSFAASEKNLTSLADQVFNLMWQKHCDHETKKKLMMEKHEAEKGLKLKQQINSQLEKEISLVHETMKYTQDKVKALQREKNQMSLKLAEKMTEIENLQKDMQTKDILVCEGSKLKGQMENQLTMTKESLSRCIMEKMIANEAKQKAEAEKNALSEVNLIAEQRVKELMDQIYMKDCQIEKLTQEINNLRQELKFSLEDLKNTHAINEVNQEQLIKLDEDKESLERELSMVNESVKSLNRTVAILTSQRNDLEYECNENKSEVKWLTEKNNVLEDIKKIRQKMCAETVYEIKSLQPGHTDLSKLIITEENEYQAMFDAMLPYGDVSSSNVYDVSLEAKSPLKVHSWHSVEVSAMSKHEMIMRTQFLLKKLMIKSKEVTSLEKFLKDKAALLNHFKQLTMKHDCESVVAEKTSEDSLDLQALNRTSEREQ